MLAHVFPFCDLSWGRGSIAIAFRDLDVFAWGLPENSIQLLPGSCLNLETGVTSQKNPKGTFNDLDGFGRLLLPLGI